MRKKGVLTSYKIADKKYSSYITGVTLSEIKAKIYFRGLDEVIESSIQNIEVLSDFNELSNSDFIKEIPNILHLTCFLSFIALKSKCFSVDEIVGDEGILHDLIHLLNKNIPVTDSSVNKIRSKIVVLQQKVVGVY